MKAIIDTVILIDYLLGSTQAEKELKLYKKPHISIITWMEVLVGAKNEAEETEIRLFLSQFEMVPVSAKIADLAVKLRREHRIKLPDAIIWATAISDNIILVTRNTKDFSSNDPSIRIPY